MNEVTQPAGGGRVAFGSALAMIAALAVSLALAAGASAASSPLAGGTTTITLGKGFSGKLAKSGVKLLAMKPGTVKSGAIGLPVASGAVDPLTGQGTVAHSGGFKFKRGGRSAPVQELVLETGSNALIAKVAGKKMKLATTEGLGVARDGFGINLVIGKLKLSAKAAKTLNTKLGFLAKAPKGKGKAKGKASASKRVRPLFKGNQALGGSVSDTEPTILNVVPAGPVQLWARDSDVPPFNTAEVKPLMIAPATIGSGEPPPFFFPTLGGTISPNGSSGSIQTGGGVRFVQEPEGGTEVSFAFAQIAVDLTTKTSTAELITASSNQEKYPVPGNLGRRLMGDLDFSGATVSSNPAARTVTVANVHSLLRADLAAQINDIYNRDAFKAGDSLGAFTFTVQAE